MHFLSREATVAEPGYSRWLVPPAAIAVHVCIGEVYGFSVFNIPLTQVRGITGSTSDDWTIPQVGWIYSIALFMLGLSAALFGKWVERSGPRKTMLASWLCFCGGLVLAAIGVWTHQILLLYLGYGFVGGIGLGLGYIAPVSTLIKWFPDRPGMATGMAIMGFGGGALLGAPLSRWLMGCFRGPASVGVAETFLALAGLYTLLMWFGALIVRVPPETVSSSVAASPGSSPSSQADGLTVDEAWRTPQFWLLWVVLCMNVSAGIGILGQASLMYQDMFAVDAAAGAWFTSLLSLFNMGGRFVWSSISDLIGRRRVYAVFFLCGAALYALVPVAQQTQNNGLFLLLTALIMSMYGGGFATIPAYLRDLFGKKQIGAIHGRLITAWSIAAVVGPSLINYISTYNKQHGTPPGQAYNATMFLMSGLLLVGFAANSLVRPLRS